MNDRRPATVDEVNRIVARHLKARDTEQLATFKRYRIEAFSVTPSCAATNLGSMKGDFTMLIVAKIILIVLGTLVVHIALRWRNFKGGHGSRPRVRVPRQRSLLSRKQRQELRKRRRELEARDRASAIVALFSPKQEI